MTKEILEGAHLEFSAQADMPTYSDAGFEQLLLTALPEDTPLRKAILKEYRRGAKRSKGFEDRAHKAEKQLAKRAREDSMWIMAKSGLTLREISGASGVSFNHVGRILNELQKTRTGSIPDAARGRTRHYSREIAAMHNAEAIAGDDTAFQALRENDDTLVKYVQSERIKIEDPNNLPDDESDSTGPVIAEKN